jgi:hypothetical protein
VWSSLPTHEPLVTREIFEAASTVARFRQGSRSDASRGSNANLTYRLRTEERQRHLLDAFHLELRYNDLTSELDLRVTITESTAAELCATVQAVRMRRNRLVSSLSDSE